MPRLLLPNGHVIGFNELIARQPGVTLLEDDEDRPMVVTTAKTKPRSKPRTKRKKAAEKPDITVMSDGAVVSDDTAIADSADRVEELLDEF